MKTSSSKLIIFLCVIKLALSASEQLEIKVETTHEVTTEILKGLEETVETTTVMLDFDALVETTTLILDLDVAAETTTTPSCEEATTQNTKKLEENFETTTTPTEYHKLKETIETTATPTEDLTTPSSVELENYAVKQMNFILDQILQTSYDFVSQVLQESDNSISQRDKLKRYAELLHNLLNDSNNVSSDYDHSREDPYNAILTKFTFLKGKGTKYLHKYLPHEWLQSYTEKKQEISIWLDKTSEQMREEFNAYVSEENDQVKFQYFNEAFDDIPRANEIHQKLTILADLVKIATNKKQITFMDLYMQS